MESQVDPTWRASADLSIFPVMPVNPAPRQGTLILVNLVFSQVLALSFL
jgi:hypothetical protein